jgi:hypothetical protein
VLLATLLAAAPGLGKEPECSGTLSGSVQGKFTCVAALTTNDAGQVYFVITPKDMIDGVPSYAPGAFEIPAPPEARTYTLDTLLSGRASVAAEGGALYTATRTTGQRGEVSLTFKGLTPDPKERGAYLVHGTYRARLLPTSAGKRGEVVVEVRF